MKSLAPEFRGLRPLRDSRIVAPCTVSPTSFRDQRYTFDMKSLRVERLVVFCFGFLPGVCIGGLAVIGYVNFQGGIVQIAPSTFVLPSWLSGFDPPPASSWWTSATYDNNAIHVPMDSIVLVRSKDTLGAIQFSSFDIVDDVATGHVWLFKESDDGSLTIDYDYDFAVWEETEVVGTKFVNGKQQADVRYAGGELFIRLGDLSIEWSQSTWLYFQPGVAFALLEVENIEDVTADLLQSIQNPDKDL